MTTTILKNPIILGIIAGGVTFAVMTYFYSDKDKKEKDGKDKKKSKNDKKNKDKKSSSIKETNIIVSVIVALVTWYVATMYINEKTDVSNTTQGDPNQVLDLNAPINVQSNQVNQTNQNVDIQKGGSGKSNVPHISSEDPTRSYNLIGSGLNIPRADLKIPSVLIDYK